MEVDPSFGGEERLKQLIEKAKRYVRLCGSKMYAEVEELASHVGMKLALV